MLASSAITLGGYLREEVFGDYDYMIYIIPSSKIVDHQS